MKKTALFFLVAKIPLDFLAAFLAWILAWKIRPITDLIPFLHSYFDPRFIPPFDFIFQVSFFSAPFFVLIAAFLGAYHLHQKRAIGSLLLASLFWGMAIVFFFDFILHRVIFSRMMLLQSLVFAPILALFFRSLLSRLEKFLLKKGKGATRIFFIGKCEAIQKEVRNNPEFFLVRSRKQAEEIWILEEGIDRQKVLDYCFEHHKRLRFVPAHSLAFARMDLEIIAGTPLLQPIPFALGSWGRVGKRVLDLLLSLFLLLFLSPFFLLISLLILTTSKGAPFYKSIRLGRNGEKFFLWKFRSMVKNADQLKKTLQKKNHRKDSPFFKVKNDPRITSIGRFLRRFSLDELPQLWNVLRGEMSLIGPRPHLPEEIKEFSPNLKRILSIKPGLSGLAQVSGRSDLNFEEEMRLDLLYVEEGNFWMDTKIFFKSAWVMLEGKGAD